MPHDAIATRSSKWWSAETHVALLLADYTDLESASTPVELAF